MNLSTFAEETFGTFAGSINFTPAEVTLHHKQISQLVAESSACATETHATHLSFFAKWGISPFYGDNSDFSRLSTQKQIAYLGTLGVPADILSELRPMSCIGLAYMCLKEGFLATGQAATWQRIFEFTQKNGGDGSALQFALQKLGWKIYFWNPDINQNKVWDTEETREDPQNDERFWGYHAYRWQTVTGKTHQYLYNPVDDYFALTGFNRGVPSLLATSPFYVGMAHGGYHVFLGLKERIIEGHSTKDITNKAMVENNRFDPLNPVQAGPSGRYRSGLMALPPPAQRKE